MIKQDSNKKINTSSWRDTIFLGFFLEKPNSSKCICVRGKAVLVTTTLNHAHRCVVLMCRHKNSPDLVDLEPCIGRFVFAFYGSRSSLIGIGAIKDGLLVMYVRWMFVIAIAPRWKSWTQATGNAVLDNCELNIYFVFSLTQNTTKIQNRVASSLIHLFTTCVYEETNF